MPPTTTPPGTAPTVAVVPAAATCPAATPPWTRRGTPAYRRTSIALFLAGFATFSLLYCVQPLLPVFAAAFHVSPGESALAVSLTTGPLALAILCVGAASESLGRRGLMCASMCAAALLNIAAGLVPGWHALLAVRALEGFVLGGVPAVAMAYLAEEIEPGSLGFAMGLYVSGTAFGGMVGRVGIGMLTEFTSWRHALGVIGAIDLAAAIGFVLLLPPSRHFARRRGVGLRQHAAAWAAHLRHPGLPWLFAIALLVMGAFVTVYNVAGFRLLAAPYGLSQTAISFVFVVYVFGMASSSVAGAMADRFGRAPVLCAGTALAMLGIAITLLQPLAAVIAGIALMTIGFFVAHSVASGWVGRMAVGAKGHAASLYLLAYYLGSSLMGPLGGWCWTAGGWPAVAAFSGGLFLLAALATLRLRRFDAGPVAAA